MRAGYDTILIETVGVGQDEVDIARLADVTAVVLVPGMGDEVQAIKAGIMEIGDVYLLNKADQPGIDRLEQELESLLSLPAPMAGSAAVRSRTEGSGFRGDPAMRAFHASGVGAAAARAKLEYPAPGNVSGTGVRTARFDGCGAAAQRVSRRETDPFSIVDDWLGRY